MNFAGFFFSRFQGHPAKNLLGGEIRPNKNWLCEKGSNKGAIIIQLKKAAILTSIHVGNAHSAFVEILVGKAADVTDHYEVCFYYYYYCYYWDEGGKEGEVEKR